LIIHIKKKLSPIRGTILAEYDFLKKIIKQKIAIQDDPEWTFHEDIEQLSQNEKACLIELYCDCLPTNKPNIIKYLELSKEQPKSDGSLELFDNKQLENFLRVIFLSEFRIDDLLLHPPEMRFKEIELISNKLGCEPELVNAIYLKWHGELRKKVI
jgi:hypothetical protein